jgi:hypothetical protein
MSEPSFLVGTWLLVSQHTLYPDGHTEPTRGDNPQGILMYDALGNISVQLMRTDDRAGSYTDLADFNTAMEGYHAYFGRYEIDEEHRIVIHHVIGSAYMDYRGSDQVRHYELIGDILTLTVKATSDGTQRILVWRRAK